MHWRGHSSRHGRPRPPTTTSSPTCATSSSSASPRWWCAGIDPAQIILDPGLGFAKTADHNWALLGRLDELQSLGHRSSSGRSRKRFLGAFLPADATPSRSRPADRGRQRARRRGRSVGCARARRRVDASCPRTCGRPGTLGRAHEPARPASPSPGCARPGPSRRARARAARRPGFVIDVTVQHAAQDAAASDDLTTPSTTASSPRRSSRRSSATRRPHRDRGRARVADLVLAHPHAASRSTVTVHKPHAPITVPFDDVAVTIDARPRMIKEQRMRVETAGRARARQQPRRPRRRPCGMPCATSRAIHGVTRRCAHPASSRRRH